MTKLRIRFKSVFPSYHHPERGACYLVKLYVPHPHGTKTTKTWLMRRATYDGRREHRGVERRWQ